MKLMKVTELPKRWPFSVPRTFLFRATEITVITIIGTISKFWLKVLSTTRTENLETLAALATKKSYIDRPVLTVSNHYCCIDDPVLFGLLPLRLILNPKNVRWTPGADEVMFYKDWYAKLFGFGRVVPVIRGWGVYQKCMNFCLEKIDTGGWVHLFVEGKVNMDHRLLKLKWGAARLILDAKIPPIVLPMWHIGMDDFLPNRPPYIPQIGKKITLVVGNPMDVKNELKKLKEMNFTRVEIRKRITDLIEKELRAVRLQCEEMHHKLHNSR